MEKFKLGDIDNERFYMLPKSFFICDEYKDMCLTAKVLYSVLHDRMDLSRSNGWVDDNDNIFLIYPVDSLATMIGVDRKTIFKSMSELKEKGLLVSEKQGLGRPNKLYLCKLKPTESKNRTTEVPKKDYGRTEKGTMDVPKSGTSGSGENGTLMILSNSEPDNNDTDNSMGIANRVVSTPIPYQSIVSLYNDKCSTLPKVQRLTSLRKKAIKARWDEYGKSIDTFKECFERVDSSDFLSGRNGKWSNCCFDWILKPANFIKIMEGNYNKDSYRQPILNSMATLQANKQKEQEEADKLAWIEQQVELQRLAREGK